MACGAVGDSLRAGQPRFTRNENVPTIRGSGTIAGHAFPAGQGSTRRFHTSPERARAPRARVTRRQRDVYGRARVRRWRHDAGGRLAVALVPDARGDPVQAVTRADRAGRLRRLEADHEMRRWRSRSRLHRHLQRRLAERLDRVRDRRNRSDSDSAISTAALSLISAASLPAHRAPGTFRASRAISSAGRAPSRQGGGRWFEPSIAHSPICRYVLVTGEPARAAFPQQQGHEAAARPR